MFSVIIPLYNKELSIGNTIQSVLNQTYQDYEIVIVNDGSTDSSLQVVEKINDSRIRIINKPNRGVSSARNRGIKEAKYEWIAFLDGDDLWDPNKLEELYKIIISNNNIDWIITAFTIIINNKKKNEIKYFKSGILSNIIDDLLQGLKIHTSAVIVKKERFLEDERLYFTEGINNSEDREVWYKLCCKFPKPYYVNKTLSTYFVDRRSNSLTSNHTITFLSMERRLECFINQYLVNDNIKLRSFIESYNKGIMLNYWVNQKTIPDEFKKHLSEGIYTFYCKSVKLPKLLKKITSKFIYKVVI